MTEIVSPFQIKRDDFAALISVCGRAQRLATDQLFRVPVAKLAQMAASLIYGQPFRTNPQHQRA